MNYAPVAGSVEIERSITQPTEPDVRKLIDDYGKSYREKVRYDPEKGFGDHFILGRVEALEFLLKRLGQEKIIKQVHIGTPLEDISKMKLSVYPAIGEHGLREILSYYEVAQSEICMTGFSAVYISQTSMEFEHYQGASFVFEEFLKAMGQTSAMSKIANFAQARLNAGLIQQQQKTYLL